MHGASATEAQSAIVHEILNWRRGELVPPRQPGIDREGQRGRQGRAGAMSTLRVTDGLLKAHRDSELFGYAFLIAQELISS